jgi:hypothetical protein
MHMPLSGEYKYMVQACCSLSYYPEFHMLRAETARTLGDWISSASGDLSMRLLLTMVQPSSKRWNTCHSATISITYASAATTLAPMVW